MKNLKNAVIEIEEVEFLINAEAAEAILREEKTIMLRRLIDQQEMLISLHTILKSLKETGIVDHLD